MRIISGTDWYNENYFVVHSGKRANYHSVPEFFFQLYQSVPDTLYSV